MEQQQKKKAEVEMAERHTPLMELVGMMPSAVPPYPPDTMEVSLRLGPDTITCCRSCKQVR